MLLFVTSIFGSCAVGTYVPHVVTNLGTQTTVVLDKANFRVVRNVEAVVEVDNDRLRRADVEESAFAELMRLYPLTGSQTYINVVCEEMQREKVFAFHTGRYALKQYVAVRATIIEFLQDNGEPIESVESPYNTFSQRIVKEESQIVETLPQNGVDEPELSIEEIIQDKATNIKNHYYLMYLLKSNNFDYNKQSEAEKYFNIKDLQKAKNKYSLELLEKLSAEHDKYFERYALNL